MIIICLNEKLTRYYGIDKPPNTPNLTGKPPKLKPKTEKNVKRNIKGKGGRLKLKKDVNV